MLKEVGIWVVECRLFLPNLRKLFILQKYENMNVNLGERIDQASRFLVLMGIYILTSLVVFPLLAALLVMAIYGLNVQETLSILQNPNADTINILKIFQVVVSLGGFAGAAFIFLRIYKVHALNFLNLSQKPNILTIFIVSMMVLFFVPIVLYLGALNSHIPIPEWFGLKEMFLKAEQSRSRITEIFLVMPNVQSLLLNILVMALVPALAEEIFFRGLLQRYLFLWNRSVFKSIFLSALIFSLFHFRFNQIIPILAAGFLFGYIYHYTQNLYYTIFGHVLYNSIVIVANFFASRSSRFDFMKEDYSPSVIIVLISALAFVFVWSIFIKKNILVKGAGHE